MKSPSVAVPYHPVDPDDDFASHLQHRGWTLVSHKPLSVDDQVIRPRWQTSPVGITYPEHTFAIFFDEAPFRALLHLLLKSAPQSRGKLMKQIGPAMSTKNGSTWLAYCEEQAFLVQDHTSIQRGSQLAHVRNIGPTLEWAVMDSLQRRHHAVARRCVQLQEMSQQGDLDVIALLDGLMIFIECKSSSSTVSKHHLRLFLERAKQLRPDIALLLIDTKEEAALEARLQQMGEVLGQHVQKRVVHPVAGDYCMYWIRNNLCIANTPGPLSVVLDATVRMGHALRNVVQGITQGEQKTE